MPNEAVTEKNQTSGVIPAAPWRVKALTVMPGYRLSVTFQDGTSGIADLSGVLTAKECGAYEALKDKSFFEQAHIEIGVVTWPNGADIDPAWMYEEIKDQKTWSVPI
jgi:hypothetical protein